MSQQLDKPLASLARASERLDEIANLEVIPSSLIKGEAEIVRKRVAEIRATNAQRALPTDEAIQALREFRRHCRTDISVAAHDALKRLDKALHATPQPADAVRAIRGVIDEMIEVAANDDDSVLAEWTADNLAQLDQWQLRLSAALSAPRPAPVVSIQPMSLSDGRTDYFVSIKVGDREVTPHVFREEYKAAYHVALYDWLLNGNGEEPDVVAFGPDDWPARRIAPVSSGQRGNSDRWTQLPFDGRPYACATSDCERQAAWRFEAGGVASDFCSDCKAVIQRGSQEVSREQDFLCESCGSPLSHTCPSCRRAWEK